LKTVLAKIRKSGAALSFEGSTLTVSGIPNWTVYRLVWDHRQAICAVGLVTDVMRQKIDPIEPKRNCTFCTKYRQYTCHLHQDNEHGIPPAVLVRGCDEFTINAGIYF
jgi:hypothetical protein